MNFMSLLDSQINDRTIKVHLLGTKILIMILDIPSQVF